MTHRDEFGEVYNALVERHGLQGDVLGKAVARAATALLVDTGMTAANAALADALLARLPAARLKPGVWDTSKLDDAQQDCLTRLLEIMEVPGAPPPEDSLEAQYVSVVADLETSVAANTRLVDKARFDATEIAYWRHRAETAEAALASRPAAADDPAPSDPAQPAAVQPSNVVVLDPRGNGSAVIDKDMTQRYPPGTFPPGWK
jgi:hypothetical protein